MTRWIDPLLAMTLVVAGAGIATATEYRAVGDVPGIRLAQAGGGMSGERAYGWQLMTERERLEYRERMRSARSAEERQRIQAEHHARMQERAREQGMTLPEEPRAGQGMGRGMMDDDMRRRGKGGGSKGGRGG